MPAAERCQRGIGRTFQVVKSFETMSVIDNVIVGALVRATPMREARRKAHEVLEFCRACRPRRRARERPDPVGKAPARSRPRARDRAEAAAARRGPDGADADRGARRASNWCGRVRETGVTVLMVEHVMEIVMPLVDRAIVLDLGKVLVEGKPEGRRPRSESHHRLSWGPPCCRCVTSPPPIRDWSRSRRSRSRSRRARSSAWPAPTARASRRC